MRKTLQKNCGKIAKIRGKTAFLAISVFRPADRNFGRNVSADFDRNFGRNFGFGRTLKKRYDWKQWIRKHGNKYLTTTDDFWRKSWLNFRQILYFTVTSSVRPKPKFRPKFRWKSAEMFRPKFRSAGRNAEMGKNAIFGHFLTIFCTFFVTSNKGFFDSLISFLVN